MQFALNRNEGGGGAPLLFLSDALRSCLNFFGLVLALFLIIVTQNNIPPLPKPLSKLSTVLPDRWEGRFLLGYRQCVADLFWFKALQIIGSKTITEEQYRDVYDMLDVTTTLDPKFEAVYIYGGPFLSIVGNLPDKSQALLHKGHDALPNNWQILFSIAFNDYIYLQNYASAAKNMEKVAALPDAPPIAAMLASRLHIEAGNPSMAIAFLVHMVQTTKDEAVKKSLLQRIKEIQEGKIKGIFRPPAPYGRP